MSLLYKIDSERRNEIDHTCGVLPQAGNLIGMPAVEAAGWAAEGNDVIRSALGLAVLNAAAQFDKLQPIDENSDPDAVFAADIRPGDTIGVIGYIGPVISRLQGRDHKILIFERDAEKEEQVYPESAEPELLPNCQVVFITSSTLINGTLESLLHHCSGARDIVMVGSSTPLYPEAFAGTGVTFLSGTEWLSEHSASILTGVSQCAGIRQLMKYGRKISVKVPTQ